LPAEDSLRFERRDRLQHFHALVANRFAVDSNGRLHRQDAQHLEEVVLDHVANRSRAVVEAAPALHPEVLGHRDLDAVDVAAVPARLEHRVGEAELQHAVDGTLAEVVIDAEDRGLGKRAEQHFVELPRRGEARAERLLDDDASPLGGAGRRQPFDDRSEQDRRDREVVRRAPGRAELAAQRLKCRRIVVIAVDVTQER
jgi:hypothetical protein